MLIGTDISLDECLDSGYLIMRYDARKIKPGQPIKETEYFSFYQPTPAYMRTKETQSNPPHPTTAQVAERSNEYRLCLDNLIEMYQDHKNGIDSFIGDTHSTDPKEYTDPYQILQLASDVAAYCGLD